MKEDEESRQALNQIQREIMALTQTVGELETKLSEIKTEAIKLWKKNDQKLDVKEIDNG